MRILSSAQAYISSFNGAVQMARLTDGQLMDRDPAADAVHICYKPGDRTEVELWAQFADGPDLKQVETEKAEDGREYRRETHFRQEGDTLQVFDHADAFQQPAGGRQATPLGTLEQEWIINLKTGEATKSEGRSFLF